MDNTNNTYRMEDDKICINCNYFFPYLLHGPSEYGICLNDPAFDPYIDELLENQNYDICQELVDLKKFDGNENYCENFEMVVFIEDELSTDVFDKINSFNEQNLAQNINTILKHKSVEEYLKKLKSPNRDTQLEAFNSLSALSSYGNIAASKLIVKSFKEIPPPITLVDVHHKQKLFRIVNREDDKDEIIAILIRDLYETKSNNQTRQWISEILKSLRNNRDNKMVKESLTKMLNEKQFSYRIKNIIKEILKETDY